MASSPFAVACRQVGRLFHQGTLAGLGEGQLLDRFVARRDPDAFEAIVARHGPTVLAACRSLLRDPNDVDDAFQATFLVLVRKAGSLRHRDLLGPWLHAVARRVALRVRHESGRRKERESRGPGPRGPIEPEADLLDLRDAVHAEVDRLPDSYRTAVVLCDLQGRTHEEASRELGWPVGTVKGRLSRARGLLRDRLARRGLAPSAGAVLALLANEGRAAVPPALIESTASAASAVAAGPLAVAGAASARVLDLTQGVLTTMTTTTTKLKLAATLLVVGALAGPGASGYQAFGPPATPRRTVPGPTEKTKVAVPPASSSADDRIQIAQKALGSLRKAEARGANSAIYEKILLWERRLAEARIDAGVPRAEAVKPLLEAIRGAGEALKSDVRSGGLLQADADEAEYRRLEAQALLEGPKAAPTTVSAPPQLVDAGGSFGGGGGGAVEDHVRRPRKQHPADIERNKLLAERLDKPVTMNFPNETPLEDVLKYIKEATKDEKGKSIPIYADPLGFQNAEKTLQSPISLDLEDVPLRTTLRLILAQLTLDYRIRDGMLYISDQDSLNEDDHFIVPDPSDPLPGTPGFEEGRAQPTNPNRRLQ